MSKIQLYILDELKEINDEINIFGSSHALSVSNKVHIWLKEKNYDFIHFQEYQGNGFVPLQAKKAGRYYHKSVLTTTAHSSEEWVRSANNQFGSGEISDILKDYYERYSIKNADLSIFPSHYMKRWVSENKWIFSENRTRVIPYFTDKDIKNPTRAKKINPDELVFFGRLETRKGLELFINVIKKIYTVHKNEGWLPEITFLGRHGLTEYGRSDHYIRSQLEGLEINFNILSNKDKDGALSYLKSHKNILAVVASLDDNLPNTVIECLLHKIPLIASNVGGIKELICSPDNLFEPTEKDFEKKLINVLTTGIELPVSLYDRKSVSDEWDKILLNKNNILGENKIDSLNCSTITICIPNYNHGEYLVELIQSLDDQSIQGFQVLIVDDGSDDPKTLQILNEIERLFLKRRGWRLLKKENAGVCKARNYAMDNVLTSWVIFMDADNIASPKMVESFCSGGESVGDIKTCYFKAFEKSEDISAEKFLYLYNPSGGCTEAGLYGNYFGDANFMVHKSTFFKLGGFFDSKHSALADWEFLARASIKGFNVDVIPEYLFYYRHLPGSMLRTANYYQNHKTIINAYTDALPLYLKRILEGTYFKLNPPFKNIINQALNKPNESTSEKRNIFKRIMYVLSGAFDEKVYIRNNIGSFQSVGIVDWFNYPKLHFILFNLNDL